MSEATLKASSPKEYKGMDEVEKKVGEMASIEFLNSEILKNTTILQSIDISAGRDMKDINIKLISADVYFRDGMETTYDEYFSIGDDYQKHVATLVSLVELDILKKEKSYNSLN